MNPNDDSLSARGSGCASVTNPVSTRLGQPEEFAKLVGHIAARNANGDTIRLTERSGCRRVDIPSASVFRHQPSGISTIATDDDIFASRT